MEIRSPSLPIVGPPGRKTSAAPKVVVAVIITAAVCFVGFRWWMKRHFPPAVAAQPVAPSVSVASGAAPGQPTQRDPVAPPTSIFSGAAPAQPAQPTPIAGQAPATGTAESPPAVPQEPTKKSGPRHLAVTIQGPLETTLVAAVGSDLGPSLAQVLSRSMVWWLAVPADLRRGDKLDALFEERTNEEPVVHMIRLVSGKMGQTLAAYRFKPEHSPFARFFKPNGEELELRLKDGPLDDYEQVTSLINDGRHHKGVDFKTPVGTQVKATFNGTVTRKTWHFRGNGNSIEIAEDAPPYRTATFLHLSPLPRSMQVGHRVKKGEIIAGSGNTGHSFAPHLHYQLMLGTKLLDPFRVHDTYRKRLNDEDKLALDAEIRRLDGLMAMAVAGK